MKKVKIVIFITSTFVILAIAIYLYLNQIEVKEEYDADIFDSIVTMYSGSNNSEALCFIVSDEHELRNIVNRMYFGSLEHKYLQYTKYDKLMGRVGNKEYADKVSEFVNVASSDVWRSVNITNITKSSKNLNETMDSNKLPFGGLVSYYGASWNEEGCIIIKCDYMSITNQEIIEKYIVYNLETERIDKTYEINLLADTTSFEDIVIAHKCSNTTKGVNQSLLHFKEYRQANRLADTVINLASSYPDGEPNGCPIALKVSDLPQNNTKLYDEFPELIEVKNDNFMDDYYVILVFPYSMNADEVVTMITEEGHEVSYEGVYIHEKLSVDGERHYVGSFEEFEQYRRIDEEQVSLEKYEK